MLDNKDDWEENLVILYISAAFITVPITLATNQLNQISESDLPN